MDNKHKWIPSTDATVVTLVMAVTLILLGLLIALPEPVSAQGTSNCGNTQVTIFHLDESDDVLRLSDQETGTFDLDPKRDIRVEVKNAPDADSLVLFVVVPFFVDYEVPLDLPTRDPGSDDLGVTVLANEYEDYVEHLRGVYEVRAQLYTGNRLDCEWTFKVKIGGFGGIAPPATAAVAGTAGLVAVGTGAWAGMGSNTKLDLKIAIRRRRASGMWRWIPTIAWRKTTTSTIIGVITGLLVSLALQQAGLVPLSTSTIANSMAIGGGVSFGVGMVWGSVAAFVRSDEEPENRDSLRVGGDSPQ
ncbi:MAG: hypothetical protein IH868_06870 [Chloroflexi bacterium]|nr:hypothetical protein [Chloroflexota bacterium]MCH8223119.1 hypothetical protein [Chloroflexota bacterium]